MLRRCLGFFNGSKKTAARLRILTLMMYVYKKYFLHLHKRVFIDMKELKITTNVRVYQYDELVEEDKILVDKAKAMTENSYAPYSKFHVGAAVLLSNGKIVGGSNQENAAFPSGTCAERTTVYYAHSKYPEAKFEKLAIAAKKDGKFTSCPVSPCGACRQSILEYETLGKQPVKIYLYGDDGIYVVDRVADLLPLHFDSF